ncbi:hypothetical protein L1887_56827 [Cichorium endivia]|nr:hypothetical protein L1887_56827 [Cichorium endivia]
MLMGGSGASEAQGCAIERGTPLWLESVVRARRGVATTSAVRAHCVGGALASDAVGLGGDLLLRAVRRKIVKQRRQKEKRASVRVRRGQNSRDLAQLRCGDFGHRPRWRFTVRHKALSASIRLAAAPQQRQRFGRRADDDDRKLSEG